MFQAVSAACFSESHKVFKGASTTCFGLSPQCILRVPLTCAASFELMDSHGEDNSICFAVRGGHNCGLEVIVYHGGSQFF